MKKVIALILFGVAVGLFVFTILDFGRYFSYFIEGYATLPFNISVTVGNRVPVVWRVNSIVAGVDLLANGSKAVNFSFEAYDGDGTTNFNVSRLNANISTPGEIANFNTTCYKVADLNSTNANFSCVVYMWYWNKAGSWNFSVMAEDVSGSRGHNATQGITINSLSGATLQPIQLSFAAVNPGSVNITADNQPLRFNNTGNFNFTRINITGYDLPGATDNSKFIYARNFSFHNNTGSNIECDIRVATNLTNQTMSYIQNATLPRGNASTNDGATGQEDLYLCLLLAGSELSSQTYSTSATGGKQWVVDLP